MDVTHQDQTTFFGYDAPKGVLDMTHQNKNLSILGYDTPRSHHSREAWNLNKSVFSQFKLTLQMMGNMP